MTPALFFLLIAVGLIGTELIIMQFSVFWFLFFGIGALLTSLVCWLLPELGWTAGWGLFLLSSLLTSVVLFPPLRKWQAKPSPIAGNDAIGQSAKVLEAITASSAGKVFWSGVDWPAELAEGSADLAVGDDVVIVKLEGIRLIVGQKTN